MIFYGQQGEDVFIFNNFLNLPRTDGIFVELGGMDGITYSNSKFFEDHLGYSGVLIEPTTQFHKMIHYRPKCHNFNVAVGLEAGTMEMRGTYATAGLVDTMHPDFAKRHHPNSEVYQVRTFPFHEILKHADISYIDFLSLDVEGGELVVLKTMDFNIPVYVIVIELDGYNVEKDQACRDILFSQGFTLKRRFANNEFWANDDYFRKSILYDSMKPKIRTTHEQEICFPCLENGIREQVEENIKNDVL
jgi:FkbM family methyltransferase